MQLVATVTLVLATIGLGVAAFFQSRDTKRAVKAAEKSANAAETAANVAKSSSDTAIAFDRPYVRISAIDASIRGNDLDNINKRLFPNTNVLLEPYATCTIENFGRTLAFVEKIEAQLRFSADDLQCILEMGKSIPIVTLKTGQSYQFNVPLGEPITQQRAEEIQSEKQHFWVHFNFVYRDVLGKTHQTPDKWKYIFSLDSFSGGTAYREAT